MMKAALRKIKSVLSVVTKGLVRTAATITPLIEPSKAPIARAAAPATTGETPRWTRWAVAAAVRASIAPCERSKPPPSSTNACPSASTPTMLACVRMLVSVPGVKNRSVRSIRIRAAITSASCGSRFTTRHLPSDLACPQKPGPVLMGIVQLAESQGAIHAKTTQTGPDRGYPPRLPSRSRRWLEHQPCLPQGRDRTHHLLPLEGPPGGPRIE